MHGCGVNEMTVELNMVDPRPGRYRVLRQNVRFDGNPPLHPDTGRPTTLFKKDYVWPLQPSLGDFELVVAQHKRNGWTIRVGPETIAFGGRIDVEDYWSPTLLPAHRAWLQALLHEQGTNPGVHRVSDEDISSARAGGLAD